MGPCCVCYEPGRIPFTGPVWGGHWVWSGYSEWPGQEGGGPPPPEAVGTQVPF